MAIIKSADVLDFSRVSRGSVYLHPKYTVVRVVLLFLPSLFPLPLFLLFVPLPLLLTPLFSL